MNTAALDLIRSFEGFRETPYWDVNALRTGYGSDTITMPDGTVRPVTEGDRVSRADAERDLARRVETEFQPIAERAVGSETFAALPPNQQAALVSIAYNYGTIPGTVAAAVKSGDANAAASAIRDLGVHNDGVNKSRREREAAIYGGQGVSGMEADGPGRVDRNPDRLAWAYANGKMTPEDAAIYEQGMADGTFKKAMPSQRQPPSASQDDAFAAYTETAMRPRTPFQPVQFEMPAAKNATPFLKPFGQ